MIISEISIQKNNPDRVNVYADGKYVFSADAAEALLSGIKKGAEISESDIEKYKDNDERIKARTYALNTLTRRARSKRELTLLLIKKGYDECICESVTDELEELGYINDAEYAQLFCEYALSKIWGRKKVSFELKKKGISDEIIIGILDKFDFDNLSDEIKKIIATKYRGENLNDMKVKNSILRYFVSRGFGFDEAHRGIQSAIEEISNE